MIRIWKDCTPKLPVTDLQHHL
nr:unnamed protein product [Callosobruchus analis]